MTDILERLDNLIECEMDKAQCELYATARAEIERWRSRFESLQAVSFRRASEIERLRRGPDRFYEIEAWCNQLEADIERLTALCLKWQTAHEKLHADNERLRALLGKLRWTSIDKDNMEFRCDTTCYVVDEIRRALEQKP
jgi:DNA repair exonuclease SbcCD ATPase subunit